LHGRGKTRFFVQNPTVLRGPELKPLENARLDRIARRAQFDEFTFISVGCRVPVNLGNGFSSENSPIAP
jgi:hypothetical protein